MTTFLRATAVGSLSIAIVTTSFAPAAEAASKQGEWKGYPPREWIDPAIADLQDLGAELALICSGKAGATAGVPNLLARVGGTLGTLAITKLAGGESPCLSSPKIIAIGKELFQARQSWPYVRLTQYKVVRRWLPDACELQIQVNRLAVPIRYRQLAKEPCIDIGFGKWVKPPPPQQQPVTPAAPPRQEPAPARPTPAPPSAVSAPSWTWKWVSQGQFTDPSRSQPVDPNNLSPGQRGWLVVEARNTGTATWTNSGPSPVMLGTDAPRDRNSVLATEEWVRPNRPAYLKQASVAPGGVGTFEFPFVAPASGSVKEYFNVLAEHRTWFNSNGLYFEFRVHAPAPPPSGPPVFRTVYEVWRGGSEATSVGYQPGAWSMVEFRVPADSPWIRRVSANIGGASIADFHIFVREGGGYREVVSANGVGVANNAETWAELRPTQLDPHQVYMLQVFLPQGGSVYYAHEATPGGLRTFTWCNERPNDGCPHTNIAQNSRIVTADRP